MFVSIFEFVREENSLEYELSFLTFILQNMFVNQISNPYSKVGISKLTATVLNDKSFHVSGGNKMIHVDANSK